MKSRVTWMYFSECEHLWLLLFHISSVSFTPKMKGQWQGEGRNTFKILCVNVKDRSLSPKFPINCVDRKHICVENAE